LDRYRTIRELLISNERVMSHTTLCLPKLNQRTLSTWHERKERREEVRLHTQALNLPDDRPTTSCLASRQLEEEPPVHQHEPLRFQEPLNAAGEAHLGRPSSRKRVQLTGPDCPSPIVVEMLEVTPSSSAQPRISSWYEKKVAEQNRLRLEQGEPPKKRYRKLKDHYSCKRCQQPQTSSTGHKQLYGYRYCPKDATQQPYEEWVTVTKLKLRK
jgi:hypothetical protein